MEQEIEDNSLRKWRLILGSGANDGTGVQLTGKDKNMGAALDALYDADGEGQDGDDGVSGQGSGRRKGKGKGTAGQAGGSGDDGEPGYSRKGGLQASAPNVNRWLGDIRQFFPSSVVKVMQQDAISRLNLTSLLLEKEMLESVEPDVHLIVTLMTLSGAIPEETKDTARQVVRKVVDELLQKLATPLQQAVTGSLNRSTRTRRPKNNEIDWKTTIEKNLKNYQAKYKTVIPETLYGFGRKRRAMKDVVLCIDQSGSMGTSVIYSGIFGSVMASIPPVQTKMVVFDTAVVDLTEDLQDPVDILFGVQLGGGTDIDRALKYCKQVITRPTDTVLILITDLYEGGNEKDMRKVMAELVESGTQFIVLLALNDEGAPSYDHDNAQYLANMGVPVFACTPDKFSGLMAAALSKQDIATWAAKEDIGLKR